MRPYADRGLPHIAREQRFVSLCLLRKFAFQREFIGQSGYAYKTTVRNLRLQVNLESAEVHEFIRLPQQPENPKSLAEDGEEKLLAEM